MKTPAVVELLVLLLGGGVTLQARRPVRFQVFNPLTGEVVSNVTLNVGERATLPQGPGAYICKGRFLDANRTPAAPGGSVGLEFFYGNDPVLRQIQRLGSRSDPQTTVSPSRSHCARCLRNS